MCLCPQLQLSICLYAKVSCLFLKYSMAASTACNLAKILLPMCCCIVNSLVTFLAILSTNVAVYTDSERPTTATLAVVRITIAKIMAVMSIPKNLLGLK